MSHRLQVVQLIFALTLVVSLAACGGSKDQTEPTASLVPATSTPAATATPPAPSVDTVRIPSIGVDAPLTVRVVGPDGRQGDPDGTDDVAISDFNAWPKYGGLPGAGNTILFGRVDSGSQPCKRGTVPPPCRAIFWDLRMLTKGADIQVYWQGQRYDYKVVSKCLFVLAAGKYDDVVAKTEAELLTLVTGGGTFVNGQYDSRVIVRAERNPGTVAPECVGGSSSLLQGDTTNAAPTTTAAPPTLAFDSRLPAGSPCGQFADSIVYRFRLSGFVGPVSDPNTALRITPNIPDRGWSRTSNFVDICLPPTTPTGHYEVRLKLTETLSVMSQFDHTR